MKTEELRELGREDLEEKVRELREELFNLRFRLASGQLDNHRRIRQVKREIARILTVIREQELAAWWEEGREQGGEGRAAEVEAGARRQAPEEEGP